MSTSSPTTLPWFLLALLVKVSVCVRKSFYLLYTLLTFKAMFNLAKWEYKVMPIKTQVHSDHSQADGKPAMDTVQSELSILGNEGWELVTVQDINLPDGRMFTVAYLKRQSKHV
jgi:hypothetical protein